MRRENSSAPADDGAGSETRQPPGVGVQTPSVWLIVLWIAAALFAVVSATVVIRELPTSSRSDTRIRLATIAAASWVAALPAHDRVMYIWPRIDRVAEAIATDVDYEVYPRRSLRADAEEVPTSIIPTFDALLVCGSARASIPRGWRIEKRTSLTALALPPGAPPLDARVSTIPRRNVPAPLGIIGGLASLVVVYLIGAMLLACTLPNAPFDTWFGNIAAAHLTGAAAITWLVTTWMLFTDKVSPLPVYVALLALVAWYKRSAKWSFREQISPSRRTEPAPTTEIARIGRLLITAALAVVLSCSATRAVLGRVSGDATRIWQLKARAFWIDGTDAFLKEPTHRIGAMADYPVLVPIQSWWTYFHCGNPDTEWAQIIAALFFLDIVMMFSALAARWVPTDLRRVALVILSGPYLMSSHACSGWADMPFAAFFLGIGIAIALMIEERKPAGAYLAAWFVVGVVTTKNEGLQALLAAAVILVWYAWRQHNRNGYRSAQILLGAGLVGYLPWFAIKQSLGLVTDLFDRSRFGARSFTAFGLLWRMWYATWHGFLIQLGAVLPLTKGWGLAGILIVVGLAFLLFRRTAPARPLWGLAALQLLGYIAVYMITPHWIVWHVGLSSDRLAMHVFPTLLLASFAACFGGRGGADERGNDARIDEVEPGRLPATAASERRPTPARQPRSEQAPARHAPRSQRSQRRDRGRPDGQK